MQAFEVLVSKDFGHLLPTFLVNAKQLFCSVLGRLGKIASRRSEKIWRVSRFTWMWALVSCTCDKICDLRVGQDVDYWRPARFHALREAFQIIAAQRIFAENAVEGGFGASELGARDALHCVAAFLVKEAFHCIFTALFQHTDLVDFPIFLTIVYAHELLALGRIRQEFPNVCLALVKHLRTTADNVSACGIGKALPGLLGTWTKASLAACAQCLGIVVTA